MGISIIEGLRARGTIALLVSTGAALACLGPGAGGAGAAYLTVPEGFRATTLHIPRAEGGSTDFAHTLQYPTAIDFGPEGEMFIAERNGRVKLLSSVDDVTPTLIADINPDVMGRGDRGILGMKLDPEFPAKPYLYLLYTHDAPIGGQSPSKSDDISGADYCNEGPPFTDCVASGRVVRLTLDPETDIPEGGVQHPTQDILVESWCQQFTSHSIGDLEFDSSGALLVGGGDGASWEVADNGQFANACGDPPKAGGSLRAQDVRTPETPSDPTDYNGSIIRIDPATGDPLPDNPLFEGADVRARRTLAYGLRNPFRFEIRPGTDELVIGDVGWYTWEELDRALSPPPPAQPALNFGWPCYEGNAPEPDWANLAQSGQAPLCKSLYEEPGAVTPPFFTYVHEKAGLFPGDTCSQLPGSATSGLAFYEPPEGSPANEFPASYDGALFIADSSRGCIWAMKAGPDGSPDPTSISNFVTPGGGGLGVFTPVDITLGPDGDLYVPNFFDSSIVRIGYSSGGQSPVAKIAASPAYGADDPDPLEVEFDASESSDPDQGDHLHYAWDLDGDGEFDDGADEATVAATYGGDENVVAQVRVTDEAENADVADATIYPGDLGPPVPEVTVDEDPWTVGDEIPFSAKATDLDGENVSLSWNIVIRHCPSGGDECHSHPLTSVNGDHGMLVAPSHEFPSHLQLTLTARDERGLSTQVTKDLYPKVVPVELLSDPAGVPLTFDAEALPSPLTGQMIAGGSANVSAPAVYAADGREYEFANWSDGGERSHPVSSAGPLRLTASYRQVGTERRGDGVPGGGGGSEAGVPPSLGLRIRSRPAGVRIGVDRGRRKTPFDLTLLGGEEPRLVAPESVRRNGRHLRFRRWSDGVKKRARTSSTGHAFYCAIYGVARSPSRSHGD